MTEREEVIQWLADNGWSSFAADLRSGGEPQPYRASGERCGDCMCCTEDDCHFGPGSGCPQGGTGTYDEGRSTCPCTGD